MNSEQSTLKPQSDSIVDTLHTISYNERLMSIEVEYKALPDTSTTEITVSPEDPNRVGSVLLAVQARNNDALEAYGPGYRYSEASYDNYIIGLTTAALGNGTADVSAVDMQVMLEHVTGLERLFLDPPAEYVYDHKEKDMGPKIPFGFSSKADNDLWNTTKKAESRAASSTIDADDYAAALPQAGIVVDILHQNRASLRQHGPGSAFAMSIYGNYRKALATIAESKEAYSPADVGFVRQGVSRMEAHFTKPLVPSVVSGAPATEPGPTRAVAMGFKRVDAQ